MTLTLDKTMKSAIHREVHPPILQDRKANFPKIGNAKMPHNRPKKSTTWFKRKVVSYVVALEVDHNELKPNGAQYSTVSNKRSAPHINFLF